MGDLGEALAESGVGDGDDADHQESYIIFFAIGEDADDFERGTTIPLST